MKASFALWPDGLSAWLTFGKAFDMRHAREYLIEIVVVFVGINPSFLMEEWREDRSRNELKELAFNRILVNF